MLITPQASFRFVPFSLLDELAYVREQWFPTLQGRVDVGFDRERPLACIQFVDDEQPLLVQIRLHYALDRPDTPLPVVRFLLKHELIHCEVRPEEIDGWLWHHPPAFWRREEEIAPERRRCWQWLRANIGHSLRHCAERQGIEVVRSRPGRRGRIAAARELAHPLPQGWARLF